MAFSLSFTDGLPSAIMDGRDYGRLDEVGLQVDDAVSVSKL